MCGRYTLSCDGDRLVEVFDVPDLTFDHRPTFNASPGQRLPVLARDRAGRRIGLLTWGLVPSWSDRRARALINVRAESLETKAPLRDAYRSRRCLIPADGFYEWGGEGARRVPYWFHAADRGLFTMAAVWQTWVRPGADAVHGFAIVTTAASADVRGVHHRMPLVLDGPDRDVWLDTRACPGAESMLRRARVRWDRHEVERRVGSPAQDDAGLIDPVAEPGAGV